MIELGTVRFDERDLVRQLQNDLRDDWFPDPIKYTDMLKGDLIAKQISENFGLNEGEYRPVERTLLNIPKPNFTLRYALETGLADRALYHGLTTLLIPFFDPLIPWNVFNHRHNNVRPTSKETFRPGISAWQDFIGAAKSALNPSGWLLSTDVANCFEHIDLSILRKQLLSLLPQTNATSSEKSNIRAHIELLFGCLRTWCFSETRGLPQNRDASSFLANMYLQCVDVAMTGHGFQDRYFRYMDDIKITCATEFEARRALKLLILALRPLGLYLNSKKTVITPASNKECIKDCFNEGSAELQQLDELWKKRSPGSITRALPRLRELTLSLIKVGNTDSREFRFCIHRLTNLALSSDYFVAPDFFKDLTAAIIDCVEKFPASADKVAQYLVAVDTTCDELENIALFLRDKSKSIYNWQNYTLWTVLTAKQYSSLTLAADAEEWILSGDDNPSRAGATLYLGSIGSPDARETIARHFVGLRSFLGQRNALIAVQQVPYRPLVHDLVRPHVRPDLKGVYLQLQRSKGSYFSHPQKLPLLQFPDPEIES